ncbi:hypothetical protein F5X97DRAFT_68899 [Nemania serpens]|nr:hypothetical protein F5X97DRAFT_68899 [Nemania serpens]
MRAPSYQTTTIAIALTFPMLSGPRATYCEVALWALGHGRAYGIGYLTYLPDWYYMRTIGTCRWAGGSITCSYSCLLWASQTG